MSGSVIVGNVRKPVPDGYTRIYVGRRTSYKPEYGEDFSALGNPYTMPKYTREAAIEEYRKWLAYKLKETYGVSLEASKVDELISRVQSGEKLALCCFCSPASCHAEVVRDVILLEATP